MAPPYSPRILERGAVRIAEHFSLDPTSRLQRKAPLEDEWESIRGVATKAVNEHFRSKCAYCESVIGVSGPVEVHHFRPKFGASDLSGEGSLDHYSWLTLEWDNHYAACSACNRAKRSIFPVEGERASYGADLSAERPMLLDPCRDDPVDHLAFQPDGTVLALSRRGETTIRVLNLNRKPLADARRRIYGLAEVEVQARGRLDVADLVGRGEPYVALALAALRAYEAGDAAAAGGFVVPEEMRSADRVIAEDDDAFRDDDTARRIAELDAEIGDKVAIGRSRSERLMLKAADALFAANPAFAEDEGAAPLSDATIGRLQAVIDRSADTSA